MEEKLEATKERDTFSRNKRRKENTDMDEDHGSSGISSGVLETAKADRSVWLMKCPLVVAKSWQSQPSSSDSHPLSKVVLSLDPLRSEDPSALQVYNLSQFDCNC